MNVSHTEPSGSAASFEEDATVAHGSFDFEHAKHQPRSDLSFTNIAQLGENPGLTFEVESALAMQPFEIEDSEDQEQAMAKTSGKKKKKLDKGEGDEDKQKTRKRKPKKNKGKDANKGSKSHPNPLSSEGVDAWPTDSEGKLALSEHRGREMLGLVAELYTHLRDTSTHNKRMRDTYGLWMHLDDSEDDDDDDDDDELHIEQEAGVVSVDTHLLSQLQKTKRTKDALRLNNPALMTQSELQGILRRRGLSTKGSQSVLAQRLTEAFNAEAKKMNAAGPYVTHFNSAMSKRNLEMLVMKINSKRHGDLQLKLKTAHSDIEHNLLQLQKLHDVINQQAAELMDRDALISSLNATIGALNDKLASLGEVAMTVGEAGSLLGHTMGAFAKDSKERGLAPWSLEKIADTMAMASECAILIIDKSTGYGWERAFASRKIRTKDGRACKVYHTAWHLVNISSTSHFGGQAVADVLQSAGTIRTIPDVVLIMDPCRSVHGEDHSHQLQALLHAGIPCINTAESILQCADRPVVYAALRGIRNRLGVDKNGVFKFPLVQQEFFANEAPGGIAPSFPAVTKLSSVHSGFGKIRCADDAMYNELVGVIALSTDYFTTEDLLENVVAEVHVLQIGKVLRAYRKAKDLRFRTWSERGGATQYEDIPVSPDYKMWASQVQPLFGGLDIFAIDVLQVGSGKEFIIGVHDVGCSLADHHASEDAMLIIEMVLKKVDERRREAKSYARFS